MPAPVAVRVRAPGPGDPAPALPPPPPLGFGKSGSRAVRYASAASFSRLAVVLVAGPLPATYARPACSSVAFTSAKASSSLNRGRSDPLEGLEAGGDVGDGNDEEGAAVLELTPIVCWNVGLSVAWVVLQLGVVLRARTRCEYEQFLVQVLCQQVQQVLVAQGVANLLSGIC